MDPSISRPLVSIVLLDTPSLRPSTGLIRKALLLAVWSEGIHAQQRSSRQGLRWFFGPTPIARRMEWPPSGHPKRSYLLTAVRPRPSTQNERCNLFGGRLFFGCQQVI